MWIDSVISQTLRWINCCCLQGPVFISLAAFTVYGALGYQLTAAVAFPCLSLFNLLRFPLMMLPEQILNVIQGKVALARIQKFMDVSH